MDKVNSLLGKLKQKSLLRVSDSLTVLFRPIQTLRQLASSDSCQFKSEIKYFLYATPGIFNNSCNVCADRTRVCVLSSGHTCALRKTDAKVYFLVCDNGISQIFCNCLNLSKIFSWHN